MYKRQGYDVSLPGDGMLIWHIDEHQPDNSDETHYMVGLVQADDERELESGVNRGDAGDAYPGSSGNTAFGATTAPSSHSHAGVPTGVSVTGISASGPTMTATVGVTVPGPVHLPVHSGAGRPEPAAETGLHEMVHALQARLDALEQRLSGDGRRPEPFAESGSRPDLDGAPRTANSAAGGVGHSYRRP